jgi:hypothetical protein
MPIAAKPEILPPGKPSKGRLGSAGSALFADENLDLLSHLLDDFLRVPGTPIRFGLDGIVGFVPGIGDVLGGVASSILIIAAWARGVPKVTVARMVTNVAIETAVGGLPVVGNLFDIAWRANRRNYHLMTAALANPGGKTLGSWLFLGGVLLVLALLIVLPMLFAAWLIVEIGRLLGLGLADAFR